MFYRRFGRVLIEVKLLVCPVTEDLCADLYLVRTHIKVTDNVLDKGQHCVVVIMSNTAGGVEDEEYVSFGRAGWGTRVFWF